MTSPRILVVDDEADLRELLDITLVKMGLDVDCADDLVTARAYLARTEYALILTDMRLPDGMGIELVREVAAAHRNTPIAVITAYGSADNAVAALKAGAFDYLVKPLALEQLRLMVHSALRMQPPGADRAKPSFMTIRSRLIGESMAMLEVQSQIVRLARSMAPVAITGESGSGKELAARDIHAHSARADKPFIAVNCGAIPEALMEAEFFGYRKGAFTGASEDRDGFFQAANGGTLMLDEVADLPLTMQVKLLRAIQERHVRKVGATVEDPVDVRLISATHQNLAECVERGKFRQDLYYRLNVIELRLPPLRERREDVRLLAESILQRLAPSQARAALTPEALEVLRGYSFPGNVRELENILERALAFCNDGLIDAADLSLRASAAPSRSELAPPTSIPEDSAASTNAVAPPSLASVQEKIALAAQASQSAEKPALPKVEIALPCSLPDHLDDVEREIIRRALARTRFNRTQAAELLGISLRQLRYRMQRLLIQEQDI